ncbi:MAG: hypothetical protein HY787_10390 [Deltaproteobacteria bacterium]|nr:hypothetical protein [Deltaproteobacteria bacterium]
MEEKPQKNQVCYNVKLPDSQCYHCIWLEWNQNRLYCLNRKRMVCNLYIEEVFGELVTKTIN